MIYSTILGSGLTLIVAPDDRIPMVSIDIIYEFDPSSVPDGVPHLTEHLLFESTQHLENGDVDRLLRLAGGRSTARTSWDRIILSDVVASSNLDTLLYIESERSQYLCGGITPEHLENQRAIIAQELFGMSVRKNGELADKLRQKSFVNHSSLSKEVMGQIYDLETATIDDICKFSKRWLQPQQATWLVSGDVDVDVLAHSLDILFPVATPSESITIESVQNEGHRWYQKSSENRLTIVLAAPPLGSVAEGVSDAMLYSLTQSELWGEFSSVHSVQAWSENRSYGGWMVVSFQTDMPEQTLSELEGWVQHPTVNWEQWNLRQQHLTAKYRLTNSGRLTLLQNCTSALNNNELADCFDWHRDRFQTSPTQDTWSQTRQYWDLSKASILWQGSQNTFSGEQW